MSRRWIPRRTESDVELTVALDAPSVLDAALVEVQRALKAAAERNVDQAAGLEATKAQLADHLRDLSKAEARADRAELRIEGLQKTVAALGEELLKERAHVAGQCSHASELRQLREAHRALGKVNEGLQAANEAHDSPGYAVRETVPAAGRRAWR